jgi:hypothetical protein
VLGLSVACGIALYGSGAFESDRGIDSKLSLVESVISGGMPKRPVKMVPGGKEESGNAGLVDGREIDLVESM